MEYQKFTELYFFDNDTALEGFFKVDTKVWQELCEEEADCNLTDDKNIWCDYSLTIGVNGSISLTVDTTDGFFIVDIVKA